MQAKDLRVEPPRRWNERLGGVPWLPRVIDKARAAHAGTLGAYLFGQSPMDRSCLRALGLRHRDIAAIVASGGNDDDVLAAIVARNPEAMDQGRAWGEDLARRDRLFLLLIDIDDGYVRKLRPVKPAVNVLSNSLTWVVKRVWATRF